MSLAPGTKLGSYEVLTQLGAGGMGEVYRARDTKLAREVALKILPDAFVRDPTRLARFQREAQLLAALNHPNIAAIYGLEEANGSQFLVLELVEGGTLQQKLVARDPGLATATPPAPGPQTRQGLPIDEALAIARQVGDALEAAHDKGIIHRDLKPANIAFALDGTVKVLDFGLAKAVEGSSAGARQDESPTLSLAATQMGVILGTAAYMSPEQAKGRPTDRRTDVWAFGCVLYEMLTGTRAFDGEDLTDTIAAVVRGEPDWNRLPRKLPPHVRSMLRRCLEKDRKQRLADISVALFLLNEPASTRTSRDRAPSWRMAATIAASVVVAAIVIGGVLWFRRPAAGPAFVTRFAIVPPAAQLLALQGADRDVAISSDGTQLVYRGQNGQLLVRPFDQLDARPLAGITGARSPFVSPDGRWIGFFSISGELKKVSITGGPPITLCRYVGGARSASWGVDDAIVFASNDLTAGLLSVPAGGGEPKVLTKPDTAHGESDHFYPFVLPGGGAVLFTITPTGQTPENAQIAVLDLRTGQRKTLIRGGSHAEYVDASIGSGRNSSGQGGYIVYAVSGTLRAVRFDLATLEVTSDPVPVAEAVAMSPTGAANYAVSKTGTLVYVPGGAGGVVAPRSLLWVTRQGREEPTKAPPRAYTLPRLSPDGSRVALDIRDQENDIWIWDVKRETLSRTTFDPGADQFPVWTPDSKRVIFGSTRGGGVQNLFRRAADNTGTVERLTTSPNLQLPLSISPDGRRVLLLDIAPKTGNDIMMLTLGDQASGPPGGAAAQARGSADPANGPRREASALIQTSFGELNAEVSPDGRWVAYESNESGQNQVYVRPFPSVDSGHGQISTSGGTRPLWARSGRELFYLDASNALASVAVQASGTTFNPGNPGKIMDFRYFAGNASRTYDVSPDGGRFLVIKDNAGGDQNTAPASLIVVERWTEELKARVGRK
jgi:serine/threonine-protein kinase